MRCFISTETISPVPGPGPEASVLWLIRLIQRSRRQSLGSSTGQDAASRTRTQPGRRDADRAFARNRETPWHVRADRSETPLVRLVCGLRGCARAREDSRRGSQRCNAPHRRCSRRTGVRSACGPTSCPGAVVPTTSLLRRTLSDAYGVGSKTNRCAILSYGRLCPWEAPDGTY